MLQKPSRAWSPLKLISGLARASAFLCAAVAVHGVTLDDYPYNLSSGFGSEVAGLTAGDSQNMPPVNAIVGTGSSSMRMWHPRIPTDLEGLTVIRRGFGGSQFTDLIYFADELILKYKPRAVMVYEGDNDVTSKSATRVRDDLKFLVDLCRTTQPDLRFYVISVKPSISRSHLWARAQEANALMEAYCAETEGVVFIDVTQGMLTADGAIRTDIFLSDNLHLNQTGYDVWAAAIAPVMFAQEAAFETEVIDECTNCEPIAAGDRILIDFGAIGTQTPSDPRGDAWNNLTEPQATGVLLSSMVTAGGKVVPVQLLSSDGFQAINEAGTTSGNRFPASASRDSFWVGSFDGHQAALPNKALLTFSDLPLDLTYRLSLYPSRAGMDGSMNRLTRYIVGSETIDLEASDNAEKMAIFDSLVPDEAGTISVEVSVSPEGNGRFGYVNVLEFEVVGASSRDSWGGFPIQDEIYVDTGDWMGMVTVNNAPWIYSFALSGWLYIPEPAAAAPGAWGYLIR